MELKTIIGPCIGQNCYTILKKCFFGTKWPVMMFINVTKYSITHRYVTRQERVKHLDSHDIFFQQQYNLSLSLSLSLCVCVYMYMYIMYVLRTHTYIDTHRKNGYMIKCGFYVENVCILLSIILTL